MKKETKRNTAALIAAVLLLSMAARYATLTVRGEIQPVLASWLLFALATTLSLWTYLFTDKHSLVSNIGNAIDLVVVAVIICSILAYGQNIRYKVNGFEWSCFIAATAIAVYWSVTRRHKATNLALQGILTLAYLPMLYHLWLASINTESITAWIIAWLACTSSFAAAKFGEDGLAMVYAGRAWLLVSATLILIIRLELR